MELAWVPEQLVLVNGGWGVGVLLQVLLSACLRLAVWRSYLSLPTPPRPVPRCTPTQLWCLLRLPVLFVCRDDCLRSERFLQLPGLAGSGQQCRHQSDGWGLRLDHLCRGPPRGRRLQPGPSLGWPPSPRPEPSVESAWKGLHLLCSACQTRAYPALLRNQDPSSGLAQVSTHRSWKEASG